MKNNTVVKRNGNFFIVKKSKSNHYYIALLLGNARVQAWHRITLKKLTEYYEVVENYSNKLDMWGKEWKLKKL